MRAVGALAMTLALACAACGGDDGGSSATASSTSLSPSPTSAAPALSPACAKGVETSVGGIKEVLDRVDAAAGTVAVEDEFQGIEEALNQGFGIDGCENEGSQRPPYTAVVVSLIQEEPRRTGPSKEIVAKLLEDFCHGANSGNLTSEGRAACAAGG
jgi:hypothetical protein